MDDLFIPFIQSIADALPALNRIGAYLSRRSVNLKIMGSIEEKLIKLREERIAREKARIEKLRQLNLQKYSNTATSSVAKAPTANQSISFKSVPKASKNSVSNTVKNNFHVNGTTKRPVSVAEPLKKPISSKVDSRKSVVPTNLKPTSINNITTSKKEVMVRDVIPIGNNILVKNAVNAGQNIDAKPQIGTTKHVLPKMPVSAGQNVNAKPQIGKTNGQGNNGMSSAPSTSGIQSKPNQNRYSVLPQTANQSATKASSKRVSVFERLYKPKPVPKVTITDAQKIKSDPNYLKKVIENSSLITGKRHTISHTIAAPVRRSISAVHLKRAHKSELKNCIHTWASIGEKLNKVDMKEVDEDDYIQCEKVVSAVKSERKKVKFQTPVTTKFNTPKPEELQVRLQNWLQKRGKSIDSYHHLQCFGIFHLTKDIKPLEEPKFEFYDDENKENIALESDSDDQSFTENLNDGKNDFALDNKVEISNNKWRRASYICDSSSFNESKNTTLTSADDLHNVDELVIGALNDLTELLHEDFDWEQCARWLRAIRERFPSATEGSAYWECRAALEERRGDLPASMQCWEEAIAKGTESSVADANLDQLLDKFMQLKISPNSGRQKQVDQKMVDVKNVLKSTIIRFAVQKAKHRQSNQNETPKYTVTPVRRSARLSIHGSAKRTPLQVCTTVSQASTLGHPVVFKRNEQLFGTP